MVCYVSFVNFLQQNILLYDLNIGKNQIKVALLNTIVQFNF